MRAGQLVEVLDDSGSNWMVLTIAMTTGDLETEGFLPAHILRPAGTPLCTACNICFIILYTQYVIHNALVIVVDEISAIGFLIQSVSGVPL